MTKKLITLLILIFPGWLLAQDSHYVRIIQKTGKLPPNAKLRLIPSKDSLVLYFTDTCRIDKNHYKPFLVNSNVDTEGLFTPDTYAAKLKIDVSKLIDEQDSITLTDSLGEIIYTFKEKKDSIFPSSRKKFRLIGNSMPDIFYIYPIQSTPPSDNQTNKDEDDKKKTTQISSLPAWAMPTLAGLELLAIIFLLFKGKLMGKNRDKSKQKDKQKNQSQGKEGGDPPQGFLPDPDQDATQTQAISDSFQQNVVRKLMNIESIVNTLSSNTGSDDKTKITTIEKQLSDRSTELSGAIETINNLTHQTEVLSTDISFFSGKFLRAEELIPTAGKISTLLDAIKAVLQKTVDFQDSFGDLTGPEAKYIALLLTKHARSTANLKIERWEAICTLLMETGCIADKNLKPIFSTLLNNPDQLKNQFRIDANRDLIRYIDATMILTEECQNLGYFIGAGNGQPTNTFFLTIDKLKSAALDALEITIPNVSLFTDYERYPNIKVVDDPINPLYTTVKDLPRNHILEIKTFGVGLAGEEDKSKTKIVIKK